MTYHEQRDYLNLHVGCLELVRAAARVLVAPGWQGRVMTSTAGDGSRGFGWINTDFIDAVDADPSKLSRHFNNWGGEDRFWLGPEGGPFSLWFAPGAKQELANWFTPAGLNEGAMSVLRQSETQVAMQRDLRLVNTAGTSFFLTLQRTIELLASDNENEVAFVSHNRITNQGMPMSHAAGLVAPWVLSQLAPGERTTVIVPYVAADTTKLGREVIDDYFGTVPADRLQTHGDFATFRCDGKLRGKIGISQARARNVAAAIDPIAGVLTVCKFSMPDDPTKQRFVNNSWDVNQHEPYVGDVFNSYNEGPNDLGPPASGGFFELESLGPAIELPTGETLVHSHETRHVLGDAKTLHARAERELERKLPLALFV